MEIQEMEPKLKIAITCQLILFLAIIEDLTLPIG